MARCRDRVGAIVRQVALRQDRIAAPRHERPTQFLRPEHDLRMIDARPAFGRGQIIPAVLPEDMRSFDPHRLLRQVDAAIDELGRFTHHLARAPVIFLDPDRTVAVIARRFVRCAVVDDIGSVVLPIDRWVDALERQPNRVRPRALRVLGGDDEVAATLDAGVDDVKGAIVVADVRCEDRFGHPPPAEIQLFGPVDRVGDLRPVHQVARMEDRQAWIMGEGRQSEIIVVAHPDHRRIGIIARQDRVAILVRTRRGALDAAAVIGEAAEPGWLGHGGADASGQQQAGHQGAEHRSLFRWQEFRRGQGGTARRHAAARRPRPGRQPSRCPAGPTGRAPAPTRAGRASAGRRPAATACRPD